MAWDLRQAWIACHPRPVGERDWTWIPAAHGHDERGLGYKKNDANATNATTRTDFAAMSYIAAITCAQTAIIPRNKVIEASAAASSTTARNMTSSMNEKRT